MKVVVYRLRVVIFFVVVFVVFFRNILHWPKSPTPSNSDPISGEKTLGTSLRT
jgi:hypothetical protein